jgi:outer membrane protein assembly factor BamB
MPVTAVAALWISTPRGTLEDDGRHSMTDKRGPDAPGAATAGGRYSLMGLLMAACVLLLVPATAYPGNWPQWLGPERNGKTSDHQWDPTLPSRAPIWHLTDDVPKSHSTPVVVGDRCYIFGTVPQNRAALSAYAVETGELLWRRAYAPTGEKINGHASPTVFGDRAYTYDSSGHLRCWDAANGELRWNRDLARERGAFTSWHGMTCSPLVYDGKVFVAFMRLVEDDAERGEFLKGKPAHYRTPGWKPKGVPEVHAFDAGTGADVWMNDTDGAGKFPSMVAGVLDGKPTVVVNTSCGLVGLNPRTGKARWTFDSECSDKRTTFSSPATPTIIDEHRVLFRKVRGRPMCLRVQGGAVEVAWDRNRMLTRSEAKKEKPIYYHTSIVVGDMVLVPLHGDKGTRSSLLALNVDDGQLLWRKDNIGGGSKLGGCFIVVDETVLFRSGGKIVSLSVSRQGAEVLGELTLPGPELSRGWPYSSLPVLANGKLFTFSSSYSSNRLTCFDLRTRR